MLLKLLQALPPPLTPAATTAPTPVAPLPTTTPTPQATPSSPPPLPRPLPAHPQIPLSACLSAQIVLDSSNPLNRVLEIKFGTGVFVGDFEIYARYLDNAQEVNFILDEGISRIDLYSGSETIEESGQSINVNKANSNFKMEIYVEKDYEFDLQLFIDTLNTYKAESSENQFCTLQEKNEEGELKYYNFTLDMTVLNRADFEDTFEIKAQTKKIEKNNNNWIWIAVGVGGGLLLIGIVILIVVLVRRNRFGGGMGGGSFKSYKKGTYY